MTTTPSAPTPDDAVYALHLLLDDQPYTNSGDPLHFDRLAAQLHEIILASQQATPLCIGLQAKWGMGKSSLMGQLARLLEAENEGATHVGAFLRRRRKRSRIRPAIKVVEYNAWTAEQADVQEGLVKLVLDALDRRVLSRALRRRHVLGGLKVVALLIAGWAQLGPLVNAAWSALSVDAKARNEIRGLVESAMQDWLRERSELNAVKQLQRPMIVVLVDDLDRCSPPNVIKVFEAVKVYLDAPGLVLVFGYDEETISRSVLNAKGFSESVTSRDYLEKIVQVTFRIPRATEDEAAALFAGAVDRSRTGALFRDAERKLILERNGMNPRRTKRFLNSVILERLDPLASEMTSQLLIRYLLVEMYFPEFADAWTSSGPGGVDAIEEFLGYSRARDELAQGLHDVAARWALQLYGLEEATDPAEAMRRLDQATRPAFVSLTHNRDFVSLVDAMSSPTDRAAVLDKVQRRLASSVAFMRGMTVSNVRIEGDVRNLDMRGSTLSHVDAHDSLLRDAIADEATIRQFIGSGATLRGFSAEAATFNEADFTGAMLDFSQWGKSSLRYMVFSDASLSFAAFDYATLDEAQFSAAKMDGASFRRAALSRGQFDRADLRDVDFREASITEARFRHARMNGMSFRGAAVRRGVFDGADLRDVDFRGAWISEAHFADAQLAGARFDRCQLTDVNLTDASGLTRESLRGAELAGSVWLPEGLTVPDASVDASSPTATADVV